MHSLQITDRFMQDLKHAGLELRDDGRVTGSYAVLASAARDNYLR